MSRSRLHTPAASDEANLGPLDPSEQYKKRARRNEGAEEFHDEKVDLKIPPPPPRHIPDAKHEPRQTIGLTLDDAGHGGAIAMNTVTNAIISAPMAVQRLSIWEVVHRWARCDFETSLHQQLNQNGCPFAWAMFAVIREYWACQLESNWLDLSAPNLQGIHLLIGMARCRRLYTEMFNGIREAPGAITWEPPYIDPNAPLPDMQRFAPPPQDLSPPATRNCPVPMSMAPPGNVTTHPIPTQGHPCPPENVPQPLPDYIPLSSQMPASQDGTMLSSQPSPSQAGPPVPVTVIDPEPVLCPEQQALVELAASGRNIFYTGSAGCGKSTALKALRKRLEAMGKKVRLVAPTGKVALAINGTTTWTFAGWTPNHHKYKLSTLKDNAARRGLARKRFRQTDVLIMDEISMVSNLHYERLNEIMKAGRDTCGSGDGRKAFGGIQLIVTGDFCQLPPVGPFDYCIDCGKGLIADKKHEIFQCPDPVCGRSWREVDKWAFRSAAWDECDFSYVHLNTVHRQRGDGAFLAMLQKCRLGDPFTREEVDLLMNHQTEGIGGAVKLFSTKQEVHRTNAESFGKLRTPEHVYECWDSFVDQSGGNPYITSKCERAGDGSIKAFADHRYESKLRLKVGMRVVLLHNLSLDGGLCNGSQGIVCGFEDYDPARLPVYSKSSASDKNPLRVGEDDESGGGAYAWYRESEIRRFADERDWTRFMPAKRPNVMTEVKTEINPEAEPGGKPAEKEFDPHILRWPVVKFNNGHKRTIYPDCSVNELGDDKPYSLLSRTQVPLAAAWALSIHKSQGMTLDHVIVDLSRAFAEGQVYVALSRATSLGGLKVEGSASGLEVGEGGNREVREFLREKFGS